ncbi:MAG TPA: 1,4-alpha-glucan branching protein GlgB [Longimicrobium sp.]|nr:1,4-alpha-glucan branching protein GlgB [Longimicrobium sp.]
MAQATLLKDIRQILAGEHPDPFRVLGMHRVSVAGKHRIVIRAFIPGAATVQVVPRGEEGVAAKLRAVHSDGFFEAMLEPGVGPFPYTFAVAWADGTEAEMGDPYSFASTVSELDLHLIGEGTHHRLYDVLGAHPDVREEVAGVRFAVWAPGARRVSVVGDWNQWDGRRHAMRRHSGAGVWEIFIPGVEVGARYKYEIRAGHGGTLLKSDPLAFAAELRPNTASVVTELAGFQWTDAEYRAARHPIVPHRPMTVYEVHLGSWRRVPEEDDRPLTYREMAHQLADYVEEMGFTHVELLPVSEFPYDPSWGYQVTGYYAPTSRYGPPADFKYLVNHLHSRNIGVILDWVPAHFPKDAHALRRFDGTALYEHADPRQGEQPDWGTMVFNFGRNEVRNFLLANALFWLDEYHIDGLRVDAVASMLYLDYSRAAGEWVPNRYGGRENLEAIHFLQQLNTAVRELHPGALMIAEESTAWPGVTQLPHLGGLGFHLKWNMGWMNDFLRFIEEDPVYRKYHFNLITFSLMYAFNERFVLPLSHDEVVHLKGSLWEKMPGDPWRKAANLRLALGFMWSHPGKKLLFMGGEFGQEREWSEGRSLDWHLLDDPLHGGVQRFVRDLNALYRAEPAFWETDFGHEGFDWIDFRDVEQTVVAFLRRGMVTGGELVFACNFTPLPRSGYRLGVPRGGTYRELLNSDAAEYGGSGIGNHGNVVSEPVPEHGRPHSLCITLPPLSIVVLKRDDD